MPTAQLADVRLHYRIDGEEGAPPLLLSNSLGTTLDMWEPQLAALATRFRVIRYDNRGHGQSQTTPGPYSIEQLARDAIALLDRLAINRVHFCGLSMGGMLGLWLGTHAPDRLDRLVVANTAAKIGTSDMWNARIDAVRKGGMAAIAPGVLARFFSPRLLEQPTPMILRIREALERTSPDGYIACCAAVRGMWNCPRPTCRMCRRHRGSRRRSCSFSVTAWSKVCYLHSAARFDDGRRRAFCKGPRGPAFRAGRRARRSLARPAQCVQ